MSVTLRPMTRNEYHDFYQRYVPDPVMDPRPYRYQREHVERCFDYDLSRRDWYPIFGIFDGCERCVGMLSLMRIDSLYHRCEIGIMMVDDSCKGKGYGTDALRQAMMLARERYGIQTLTADTTRGNLRMRHILTKLGFQLTEYVENAYDMGNRREDRLSFTLTLNENQ